MAAVFFVCLVLHTVAEAGAVHESSVEHELAMRENQCPRWTVYDSNTKSCVCGHSLLGLVDCSISSNSTTVHLRTCYCMSFHTKSSSFVVGDCLFSCASLQHLSEHGLNCLINFTETGDDPICRKYQRRGLMCAECKQNYAPPVYHYTWSVLTTDSTG